MALSMLRQIRQAVEQLNPNEVREAAERRVYVGLNANNSWEYSAMERFLAPEDLSPNRRHHVMASLIRAADEDTARRPDIQLVWPGISAPNGGFVFDPNQPENTVREILSEREDLALALSRAFAPFRQPVVDKTIFSVSKENALFALATAVPDILPGISLPWAIPEAASDTAVLTMNQIRMAFLLAAANDRPVGYGEQRAEVGGIVAGAFGFRAIAREIVGKIPAGAGIIPKAGIAFAATFVEGMSLARLYRFGYGYTRGERKEAYGAALERGKQVAGLLWERIKPQRG
ncbi:MAG: hypothetical protein IT168_22905 [Bryobacterales bacterium]|nr:hypothetical protein [Bryobacterales bacterium]